MAQNSSSEPPPTAPRSVGPSVASATCRAGWHALGWLAARPWLGALCVGLLAFSLDAALARFLRLPTPWCHDEFSYLLAADTFAHGKLTNPPHPMWVHFESIHIIQQPHYASKYPPGQGLVLAAGQVLGGHPLVGVWLADALACMAIYWMLRGWLRPRWAMFGGLLAPLFPVMVLWSQSYWGGSVSVLGGCLVTGALRRLMRRTGVLRDGLAMGLGMAVLANTRQFEGMVLSLMCLAILLAWALRRGVAWRPLLVRSAVPAAGVLVVAGLAMGYYNWRVTGNPLVMPYMIHEATYGKSPSFLWETARPDPVYRHQAIRDLQTGTVYQAHVKQRTPDGFIRYAGMKVLCLLIAFYPFAMLQVPLVTMPLVLKDQWMRLALALCAGLTIALLGVTWLHPHYAAPIAGLVFLLEIQAMRHLRVWTYKGRPTGRLLFRAATLLWLAIPYLVVVDLKMTDALFAWRINFDQRPGLIERLKQSGEKHLIVVRYGPNHDPNSEWVYNDADIDGSAVVWARDMDDGHNRALFDYFKDRKIWLLEPDRETLALEPYPSVAAPGRDQAGAKAQATASTQGP